MTKLFWIKNGMWWVVCSLHSSRVSCSILIFHVLPIPARVSSGFLSLFLTLKSIQMDGLAERVGECVCMVLCASHLTPSNPWIGFWIQHDQDKPITANVWMNVFGSLCTCYMYDHYFIQWNFLTFRNWKATWLACLWRHLLWICWVWVYATKPEGIVRALPNITKVSWVKSH